MSDSVLYSLAEGVATVTLNRPEVMNALNAVMVSSLRAACEEAAADPGARAVVLRGAGRAFLAGGDVTMFQNNLDRMPALAREGGVDNAPAAPARSMLRSRAASRSSTWMGLVRKSEAPRFMACTAESMVPNPVTTITGRPGASASTVSSTESPSMSGSYRSRIRAWSFSRRATASAARPLAAWWTISPRFSRT